MRRNLALTINADCLAPWAEVCLSFRVEVEPQMKSCRDCGHARACHMSDAVRVLAVP